MRTTGTFDSGSGSIIIGTSHHPAPELVGLGPSRLVRDAGSGRLAFDYDRLTLDAPLSAIGDATVYVLVPETIESWVLRPEDGKVRVYRFESSGVTQPSVEQFESDPASSLRSLVPAPVYESLDVVVVVDDSRELADQLIPHWLPQSLDARMAGATVRPGGRPALDFTP